jgi:hypothetical protein
VNSLRPFIPKIVSEQRSGYPCGQGIKVELRSMRIFQLNPQDGVTLTVPNIEQYPDKLEFTYVVTNHNPCRIYLVNQLFHRRGAAGFQVDANLVYTEIVQESTLLLRKQLIEVPEELDVEAPEVPYVTRVEAGYSFDETVLIKFPVHLHDPYRRKPDIRESFVISQFYFLLGYILEDEPIRISEVTLPTATKHLRIDYTDLLMRQRLKENGPFQASAQVVALP